MIKTAKPVLAVLLLGLAACSADEPAVEEHVWQEQADAVKRAEQVEDDLLQAAEEQARKIEQQTE